MKPIVKDLLKMQPKALKSVIEEVGEARPAVMQSMMLDLARRNMAGSHDLVRKLVELVSAVRGVEVNQIYGKPRPQYLSESRFMVWHLAYKHGDFSTTELGQRFSGRDHGSVSHGLSRAKDLYDIDQRWRGQCDRVEQEFLAAQKSSGWLDSKRPAVALAPAA